MNNINITNPQLLTEEEDQLPQILSDHIFIELDVLNVEIPQEQIEEYNKAMEYYEDQREESMSMGFKPRDLVKPEKPVFEKKYSKINLNLVNKVILMWISSWDSVNDHEIIVVDYASRSTNEEDQIVIRATKKQWMDILQQFGAVHTTLQPVNLN